MDVICGLTYIVFTWLYQLICVFIVSYSTMKILIVEFWRRSRV